MTDLFPAAEIARHDSAFAVAHPDWALLRPQVPPQRRLVDPVVCLALREAAGPEDSAPACGAWESEHCVECLLCPGVHADDCEMAGCPLCGHASPYHFPWCGQPRTNATPLRKS